MCWNIRRSLKPSIVAIWSNSVASHWRWQSQKLMKEESVLLDTAGDLTAPGYSILSKVANLILRGLDLFMANLGNITIHNNSVLTL